MKKIFLFIICFLLFLPAFGVTDYKLSEEYLKNKKHISIVSPIAEKVAQKAIKKAIHKQASGRYKVKFNAYNLYSLKKGIFKYLEVVGKDVTAEDIDIPYFKVTTLTDYNWIDYNQNSIIFKSDIILNTEIWLDEKAINNAIKTEEYKKKLQKINNKLYPMLVINDVRLRIRRDKTNIIFEYNFPIAPAKRNKTVMVSANFLVDKGLIRAYNLGIDNEYGNIPTTKITNIINNLDPLSFTVKLIDTKNCNGKVEGIKIEDDIVKINGKIYIEGDEK